MVSLTDSEIRTGLWQGIAAFREGRYFEAHEAWENPWREMAFPHRSFWQALIQLSVGAYHYQNDNLRGCRNLWNKALKRCNLLLQEAGPIPAPLVIALQSLLVQALLATHSGSNPLPLLHAFSRKTLDVSWVEHF
ncbi:MAG TPA: DUF309 domain-containing protein [Calditrichia bacterium]|nr:DUF309 domain-containing protein [Calditrichota bacterium]HQV30665.1 DUF309 domain-containing protein [Calditrichia bacterium]